ncbi:RING finger protein 145-like [Montipora capricornis]|uniref:RING finger protein 145-like n=1 Tax=Montipora capricornis TaxID=246305 RepID=UPI0035F1C83C
MQIKWAKIKAFYFRNENVLLRLPFSLCLQLSAYFDGKVKKSEEDTKTLYEMAAVFSGLVGAIGLLTHLGNLRKFFIWLIEQFVLIIAFVAILAYSPVDIKTEISTETASIENSYLGSIYGCSLLYAQVCIAVSVAIAPRKWTTILSAKQTVGMFIFFPILIQLVTSLFVEATSILRDVCLAYLVFASVIQLYKACVGVLQLLHNFPGLVKHIWRVVVTYGWLECFIFHWKRIELDRILMVTWLIKFVGKFLYFFIHGVLIAIAASLVECFDNLQDLAGASIVVGVAANLALDVINKILKGNLERTMEERHQEAWNDSISFFLLTQQTRLTSLTKPERLMLLALIMFVTISLFLQSIYELTEPALMSLGATYTGVFNSKHLRTLAVCSVILILPAYMVIVLCQVFTFDAWLFVIISSNLVTVVQVTGSLFIYALFVSNVHSKSQVKDLDDYVYYINAGAKVFEFLVALVVLGYTAWATFTGEWNLIGAVVISMHCYFNVYKRAQEGWKNFLLRRSAVKRLNSLQWATEEQLEQLNDVCCICYDELDNAKVTKCNHYFHSLCLRKWLYVQDKCPMCHADILPQD